MIQFRLMTETDPGLLDFSVAVHSRSMSAGASSGFFIAADPGFGGNYYSSQSGDPPPEEGDEIVVIGKRPKTVVDDDDPYDPGTGGGPGTGTPGGDNTSGGGGPGDPDEEPNDCPDRAAMDAADELKNDEYDDTYDESVSLIYRTADGSIQHTPVTPFEGAEIPYEFYDEILEVYGISWSRVIGMVHSHPNTATDIGNDVNRYPSGNGSYNDGDWGFGYYAIARGASDFESLYIIDPDGKMREFNWADRDTFTPLTREQKGDGVGLPDEVTGCGSS